MHEGSDQASPTSRLRRFLVSAVSDDLMQERRRQFDAGRSEQQLVNSRKIAYRYALMGMAVILAPVQAYNLFIGQYIPAMVGMAVLLLFVINWAAEGAAEPWRSVLLYVSVTENLTGLVRGVIDTRNLVYFASLITVFLFLTHRAVESARWK